MIWAIIIVGLALGAFAVVGAVSGQAPAKATLTKAAAAAPATSKIATKGTKGAAPAPVKLPTTPFLRTGILPIKPRSEQEIADRAAAGLWTFSGCDLLDLLAQNPGWLTTTSRGPVAPDEIFGGMDITYHMSQQLLGDSGFQSPYQGDKAILHIRPRALLQNMPVLIGWSNRMPFDWGHINRRWWLNDLQIQDPGGSIKTYPIHDDGGPANPQGFCVADHLLMTQFRSAKNAACESLARSYNGGVTGLVCYPYTNNEFGIPDDGYDSEPLVPGKAITDLISPLFFSSGWTLYAKNGHFKAGGDPGIDTVTSAIRAFYHPCGVRQLLAEAAADWGTFFDVVFAVTEMALSIAGGALVTAIEEACMPIIMKIIAFCEKYLKIVLTIEKIVTLLLQCSALVSPIINQVTEYLKTLSVDYVTGRIKDKINAQYFGRMTDVQAWDMGQFYGNIRHIEVIMPQLA